jgi:2'-5' RNA ligase
MTFRGFIAVDIAGNEKLQAFSDSLRSTGAHLKLVDVANIHVTLKFLGDTREDCVPKIKEILVEGLKNIKPFSIELVGAGAFPNIKRIQVIWVGTRNAEILGKVAEYLEDELELLGYRKEKRRFSPHITIARVKSARNLTAVQSILSEKRDEHFGEQLIDSVKLKQSVLMPKGPLYSVVEKVELAK